MRKPMMGSHDLSKVSRTSLVDNRCLFEVTGMLPFASLRNVALPQST